MEACTVAVFLMLLCCLPSGVTGLSCVECNTIQYSGCGYWYSNYTETIQTKNCGDGTCMITKGTYQGADFYERKCFQGSLAECEAPSDFQWQPQFKIDTVICCNATDFCNGAVTSYTSRVMPYGIALISMTAILMTI